MCGLVAVINKKRYGFSGQAVDVFEQLLYLDYMRGEDSTGVFAVNNLGNVNIAKAGVGSPDYLKSDAWKDIRSRAIANGSALVGHNRKATRGKVNDENAHPFWIEDKLVLVHNGTMFGDHKKHANVEVDSHAIAHVLAEEPDVAKAMQKVDAAYALIWYDIQNKKLNFLRNQQRPLSWMECEDFYVIASEQIMINFAVARCGAKYQKGSEINEFPEFNLNTWTLGEDKEFTIESKDIDAKYRPEPGETQVNFTRGGWTNGRHYSQDACDYSTHHSAYNSGPPNTPTDLTKDLVYPWMKSCTFKEWEELKATKYAHRKNIKVLVDDYLPSEHEGAPYVFMSGKAVDEVGAHVMFPLTSTTFELITDPTNKEVKDAIVFEVEVDSVIWRKIGNNDGENNIDNFRGFVMVNGRLPRLVSGHLTTH